MFLQYTYWKLSILLCRGFIRVAALFDSENSTLSSCTAACLALSESSRVFCRKEADLTGGERESVVPLKQTKGSFELSWKKFNCHH